MEHITLGSTPAGEECAQVGDKDYEEKSLRECAAYKEQLKRIFNTSHNRDPHCRLKAVSNPHDFGDYLEVHALYNPDNQEALEDAIWFEGHLPEEWDEEAKQELKLSP